MVEANAEVVAQKLGREVKIVADGWKSEIDCIAVHPEKHWFAWKEYRERVKSSGWIECNYYLHIVADGVETLNWPVKTYNPVFGCSAHYFQWHEDRLAMGYLENHDNYGVSCSLSSVERLVKLCPLGGEGAIRDNILYVYFPYITEGEPLRRYSLPDFVELDGMTVESALENGILVDRQPS
jgi:hypothetical protein